MGQKLGEGWVCLFLGGSLIPIEHKVACAEAYLHTKWHLSPSRRLAATDSGQKLQAVPLFGEGDWVIRTNWHLDASSRLATIEMGRKLGRGGSAPFLGVGGGWDPI